jgi:integrase
MACASAHMVTGSGFRSARERQGWNDVRAADTRNEIAALVRRGVWRPPNDFALDPREKDPGFHEFSSDWLKRYRRTVKPRSAELAENLLSRHALPFLHPYTLKDIDYALLSTYVSQKLERNDEIDRAAEVGVTLRDGNGQPRRKLGPRTINMSLDVISRVLNDAVKRGLLPNNPAAESQLRLKVQQRRGNFLEADELLAVIDAGGEIDEPVSPQTVARAELARNLRAQGRQWKEIAAELEVATSTAIWLAGRYRVDAGSGARRAILATLGCAGLRNSELSI